MRVDILSIFPGMFAGVFAEGMPRIAREKGLLEFYAHDIRAYTLNKHGKVDDRPCGGGPGMVLCCQPVVDAVEAVRALDPRPGRLIFLTPEGRRFRHAVAEELAGAERLILVCGRYEGFDQRIFDVLQPERLSVGDFILSGGEIAAMAVVDAVARLLPGVLGCPESLGSESFRSGGLDYPQYTLPVEFRGYAVPEVLRSGDHSKINAWRETKALEKTREFRPDLLEERNAE